MTHSPLIGASRDEIFDRIEWMTVRQLIEYHTIISIFNIKRNKEPEYLYEVISSLNLDANSLVLAQKSFCMRG